MYDPTKYEAWYQTPRGAWIAEREFTLMMALLRPQPGTLLDVGAGTGHFSRAFAAAGLDVTALDPSLEMLRFARERGEAGGYILGAAERLPFPDRAFDYASAVTSLCFVPEPEQALAELWRISRRGVILGLLNRHSLLHWQKAGRGGYRGARWDTVDAVRRWVRPLPGVSDFRTGSAILLPSGGPFSRAVERIAPQRLPWGGFLGVCLLKNVA
ncbi:class I SAM-dependent methyltransferase [Thiohalomonas denitrificans]|uniref:Methyltransferase domain-containing protein n=1 Tax=Thiohalomonas denitrificans TaxID=415747 RepID=A0A1G5Q9M6_9GAMM|nr:class I SAM-dependent methyltransferase [Thiohalomonas denitrificans]SCZ58372.1 Methyltransferase domain-containing protein [Thiohalomonas denitrificans]